jgi:Ca2+-binding RTX toxin-like protein
MATPPVSPVISGDAEGTGGTDWMIGDNDINRLEGGDGDDLLFGNVGFDTLNGGAGSDYLDGGEGHDTLIGGPGADVFASEWFPKPGPNLYFADGEYPLLNAGPEAWTQYYGGAVMAGYTEKEDILDSNENPTGFFRFYKETEGTLSTDAHHDTITDFTYDWTKPDSPDNDRIELYGIPSYRLDPFLKDQVAPGQDAEGHLVLNFQDDKGHIFGSLTFENQTFDPAKSYGDWFV